MKIWCWSVKYFLSYRTTPLAFWTFPNVKTDSKLNRSGGWVRGHQTVTSCCDLDISHREKSYIPFCSGRLALQLYEKTIRNYFKQGEVSKVTKFWLAVVTLILVTEKSPIYRFAQPDWPYDQEKRKFEKLLYLTKCGVSRKWPLTSIRDMSPEVAAKMW